MMFFTKAEADVLGMDSFAGTKDELAQEITNAYYVWDDSPFPYWEKQKKMTLLERLATKHGVSIKTFE